MIADSDITAVGRVVKTHGTSGELNIELYNPDIMEPQASDCLIFNIDGINVPFFVKATRQRGGDRVLVTFDDIDTDIEAAKFAGKEVFAPTSALAILNGEDGGEFLTLDDLIGYDLYDTDGTHVGKITDVDDSTENILFEVVRPDNSTVSVPAADELVTDLDIDNKKITMGLPSGLY